MRFKTKEGIIYQVNDEPVDRVFTTQELYNRWKNGRTDEIGMIFGYTTEEILKFIHEHEVKKFKMTREEAINKFQEIMYNGEDSFVSRQSNRRWSEKAISAYEALGLIKFDEQEKFVKFESKVGDRVVVDLRMSDGLIHRYEGKIEDIRKPLL